MPYIRTYPFQRRFLPLSKIVDWHFWRYVQKASTELASKRSKLNPQAAILVDMGDCWSELEEQYRTDPDAFDKRLRAKLLTERFSCYAAAEGYVNQHGTVSKLPNGQWRAIVNVNGCVLKAYGDQRAYAVRDVAMELKNGFPSEDQSSE